MDGAGNVVARHDYLPFGEELWAGVGMRTTAQQFGVMDQNGMRFALTQKDETTGLDHTWWRKYENSSGRWTSQDPVGGNQSAPQTFNRYVYNVNDPVNLIDPDGLMPGCDGTLAIDPATGETVCIPKSRLGDVTVYGDPYLDSRGAQQGVDYGFMLTTISMRAITSNGKKENPSCVAFVNDLVRWATNPKWYSPQIKADLGVTMMRIAVQNPFNKAMPYSKGNPTNGFKDNLTDYGQNGDVYRHILFVAGAVLAGENRVKNEFIAWDKKQADGGRKESLAELADDYAGEQVGQLMNKAWDGEIRPDDLQTGLMRILCK